VIIDEINSSPMMERLLNDLLMGKTPEGKRPEKPGFMLIGTQNPVTMAGRREQSVALSRRLIKAVLPNYTAEEMTLILVNKGLTEDLSLRLIKLYEQNRREAQLKNRTPWPTFRDLLRVAEEAKLHQNQTHSNTLHLLDINPIVQTGHNCKVTALAYLDTYWGQQLGFEGLFVHKKAASLEKDRQPLSLRQLAKTERSVQGELLEVKQMTAILSALGYQSELVDCPDYQTFRSTVLFNLNKNQPLVAFFAVEQHGAHHGSPSTFFQDNEHACIISGFNPSTDEVRITHWGSHYYTSLSLLYASSCALPATREPEVYHSIKQESPMKKYDLVKDNHSDKTSAKTSITPKKNTGFRNKLLVVDAPNKEALMVCRKELIREKSDQNTLVKSYTRPGATGFLNRSEFKRQKIELTPPVGSQRN
jgi:hypothetical protein